MLTEYLEHYNTGRLHRALGQFTPAQADTSPPEPVNLAEHRIFRRKHVLGGLTSEYYIAALQPPLLRERRSRSGSYFRAPQDVATRRLCRKPASWSRLLWPFQDLHPERPCVYLDHWVWIRLARAAANGEPRRRPTFGFWTRVCDAAAGGVTFPLSTTHLPSPART